MTDTETATLIWQAIKMASAPLRIDAGTFDASVVAHIMGYTARGNALYHGDWAITVLGACSSLWPLPQVCVWFVAVTLFMRYRMTVRALPWLLGAMVVSVNLTWVRLALCTLSHDSYLWWHDGPGATIYGSAALLSAITFPLMAGKWKK